MPNILNKPRSLVSPALEPNEPDAPRDRRVPSAGCDMQSAIGRLRRIHLPKTNTPPTTRAKPLPKHTVAAAAAAAVRDQARRHLPPSGCTGAPMYRRSAPSQPISPCESDVAAGGLGHDFFDGPHAPSRRRGPQCCLSITHKL